VARGTRHLKLLTEFEASRGSSVYAAKNAVSYQRFTGGRFAWQIKAGGGERQRRAQGDFVADGDRLARIEEFLTVARGVLTQSPFSFKGRFFEVKDGGFQGALGNQKVPPVYLSGSSPEDYRLSAKLADVHVFDAAKVAVLEKEVASLRDLAKQEGRQLAYGLRLDLLARETEEEAIFDAERYWQQPGGRNLGGAPTVDELLWAGLTSDSTGAAATLVGSYEQVVQALIGYFAAGIDSFLLSAVPHFEEAYRLGEHVLPIVRSQVSPEQRRAVGGLA